MPLTNEQKQAILDYTLGGDDKGILEDTMVGDTYGEPGGVTWGDINGYIREIKAREELLLQDSSPNIQEEGQT